MKLFEERNPYLVAAVGVGRGLADVLAAFPLPVLAGLLVVAAVAHVRLLRGVRGWWAWLVVGVVGVVGVVWNLAIGVLLGLLLAAVRKERP